MPAGMGGGGGGGGTCGSAEADEVADARGGVLLGVDVEGDGVG